MEGNKIGDVGGKALGEALKSNMTLKSLTLSDSHARFAVFYFSGCGSCTNPAVAKIASDSYPLGLDGIKKLDFSSGGGGDSFIVFIAGLLPTLTALKSLTYVTRAAVSPSPSFLSPDPG